MNTKKPKEDMYYKYEAKKYIFDKENNIETPIAFCGKEYSEKDLDRYSDNVLKCITLIIGGIVSKELGLTLPIKLVKTLMKL